MVYHAPDIFGLSSPRRLKKGKNKILANTRDRHKHKVLAASIIEHTVSK